MPVSQEASTIQPYFGIEMTRWMVTMMDIVAMASITLICVYTIYKNFIDLRYRAKSESEPENTKLKNVDCAESESKPKNIELKNIDCFKECPHEDKIINKNNENE